DIFVHYSSIQTEGYRTLKQGEPVEFELVDGEKGPKAENVTRVQ
ncbi:MAG TPA: cold shock domain-containing protein, partial [Phycisphaerae bacterium]|nr:cold shock domain-containing protein [Phycisphaerae bacterium]